MNYNKLKAETQRWIENGIISGPQADKILSLYDGDVPVYKKMSFWLQCLAATFVGLALFLVISENWQRFHWGVQSLISALPLVVAHAWAFWQEKRDKPLAAEVGWFFASIALGANIMLQAQIFHISAYYPNGVLFWVIGILPVIWLRASTVNYLLASALFWVYLAMQLSHHQFAWLSVLPLAVFAMFAWSKQRVYTILPLLWVIYFFLQTVLAKWNIEVRGLAWELSVLLLSLALVQQFRDLSEAWLRRIVVLILATTAFFNILLTFRFFAGHSRIQTTAIVTFSVAGVALLALLLDRHKLRVRNLTYLIAGNVFANILCLWLQRYFVAEESKEEYLFMRICANTIYLATVIVLLFQGIAARAKGLFLGSVMALLLWALVRYLDLFHNYLITALIFILSAVALVFMNKLWEKKYEN